MRNATVLSILSCSLARSNYCLNVPYGFSKQAYSSVVHKTRNCISNLQLYIEPIIVGEVLYHIICPTVEVRILMPVGLLWTSNTLFFHEPIGILLSGRKNCNQ